jgi:uncharacterized protein (DUF885 family)
MVAAHDALTVPGAAGDAESRLHHAVFREFLEHPTFEPLTGVAGRAFAQHPYLVCQEGGVQTELPLFFVNLHPLSSAGDAERYLAKLDRVPDAIGGLLQSLRSREARGLMPPRFLLEQALTEIRAFAALDPRQNPLCATFMARLRVEPAVALEPPRIDALGQRARDAVADRVRPAYAELAAEVVAQIGRAHDEPGVWRLPDGDGYYAYELRCQTSTDLGPDAVHQLGLDETRRVRDQIETAFTRLGHPPGTLRDRYQRLAASTAQRWEQGPTGRAAILARCRELLLEVEARLGDAFATLPRAPLLVQPVPDFCEESRTTTLHPASPDGARAGILEINLARELDSPRWELPTLVYHEGLPGHHLQLAIAQERASLPLFRRKIVFHAFIEGWAKYAEGQLPWEMGWNQDPTWHLGALRRELISTANLALDTGIHHRRWTRDDGIRFCLETTGMEEGFAHYLVDRIAARPGQTCSYTIGLLELRRLRARSEREARQRGSVFRLAEFHDRVLGQGALPLSELSRLPSEGHHR